MDPKAPALRHDASTKASFGAATALRIAYRTGLLRNSAIAAAVERAVELEVATRRNARRIRLAPTSARSARTPWWHAGGEGPGVVLVNGWSVSGSVWPAALIRQLQAKHRVVRVDNRGTGLAANAAAPYTIGMLAADVRRAIVANGLDRPTVVGYSMGGAIAQELALRWPGDVGRLVLVSTAPPLPDRTSPALHVMERLLASPPGGPRPTSEVRERWVAAAGPDFAATQPALLDEMVASVVAEPSSRRAVRTQFRAVAGWHGPHRLRSLRVPTTVVHGNADPLIPVANGRRLTRLIPGATYRELEGVGHLLPYEAWSLLAEVIEEVSPSVTSTQSR